MVAAPLIVATGIYKRLGNAAVLRGVDLQAHSSEVIAILGASGSGKSTLLRCLNVLEIPDEGSLTLFNEPIEYVTRHGKRQPVDNRKVLALRQRIAMVFQQFQLWTHMTALGNVSEAPYRVLKLSKQDAIDRARAYLDKVGMLDFAHAFPSQLSGGQKQRVAIARALAMNPDVILFDEPTSALDPELVGEVLKVIRALAEGARCLIIVTHEIQFARDVADTIIFLHEGIVAEHGPVTCLDNPQTVAFKRFLARFAGNDSDYTL